MTNQEYVIKSNPRYTPVYPYANSDYYIELIGGDFDGLHFNFGNIELIKEKINFDYNLLFIPENVSVVGKNIEVLIGEILQTILERGQYDFNTER